MAAKRTGKGRTLPVQAAMMDVLEGRAPLDSLDDALRSAIRFPIYRAAVHVLQAPSREARNQRLEQFPKTVRAAIKAEAERLWSLTRS